MCSLLPRSTRRWMRYWSMAFWSGVCASWWEAPRLEESRAEEPRLEESSTEEPAEEGAPSRPAPRDVLLTVLLACFTLSPLSVLLGCGLTLGGLLPRPVFCSVFRSSGCGSSPAFRGAAPCRGGTPSRPRRGADLQNCSAPPRRWRVPPG